MTTDPFSPLWVSNHLILSCSFVTEANFLSLPFSPFLSFPAPYFSFPFISFPFLSFIFFSIPFLFSFPFLSLLFSPSTILFLTFIPPHFLSFPSLCFPSFTSIFSPLQSPLLISSPSLHLFSFPFLSFPFIFLSFTFFLSFLFFHFSPLISLPFSSSPLASSPLSSLNVYIFGPIKRTPQKKLISFRSHVTAGRKTRRSSPHLLKCRTHSAPLQLDRLFYQWVS